MEITRKSALTGVERTIDIPVDDLQMARWKAGELIQYAMPQLSAAEREFIMTGITPDEWTAMGWTEDDEAFGAGDEEA